MNYGNALLISLFFSSSSLISMQLTPAEIRSPLVDAIRERSYLKDSDTKKWWITPKLLADGVFYGGLAASTIGGAVVGINADKRNSYYTCNNEINVCYSVLGPVAVPVAFYY